MKMTEAVRIFLAKLRSTNGQMYRDGLLTDKEYQTIKRFLVYIRTEGR